MDTLIDAVNMRDVQVTENGFTARMELTSFHAQPQGFVNGGAILAFAEIVGGYASIQLLDEGSFPVGQSFQASHVHSKWCEGYLTVRGELLHRGRSSHVWCVRFYDEDNRLISQVTCTNAIVRREKVKNG